MKAEVKYTFDLPDEAEEYDEIANASKNHHAMYSALWEISQAIRKKIKYESLTDEQYKCWEEISEMFWNIVSEERIEL